MLSAAAATAVMIQGILKNKGQSTLQECNRKKPVKLPRVPQRPTISKRNLYFNQNYIMITP